MKTYISLFIFFLLLFSAGKTYARHDNKKGMNDNLLNVSKTTVFGTQTLLNINNIAMWVKYDGQTERRPQDNNAGVTFPRGTTTCVYAGGLIWGGMVYDGGAQVPPQPRVGGQTYNYGTVPGRIISKGVAENANDPSVRVYRVRRDWATADLTRDAAEFFDILVAQVTDSMVAVVRQQYKKDWLEWPWQKGAPYYDRNNNGTYDPDSNAVADSSKDEPGLANADQVIWFVVNDLDVSHTIGIYGSNPIGIEMQITCWAYARNNNLDNVIFQRYRLIYKGTAAASNSARIDSMYIAKWVDPDVGDYGDDFSGCDRTHSLGYAYNGGPIDSNYQKLGLPPPAVGYDFIQGPRVPSPSDTAIFNLKKYPGYRNLPMTSFAYFAAHGVDYDPDLSNYNGTLQWYNLLNGYRPRPVTPPAPFIDPLTNLRTKFELSGDPISSSGWIDGFVDPPGDRRMALCSGPFTMALGDTQEVVVALVAGLGYDYLNSVVSMEANDRVAQRLYDSLAQVPSFQAPEGSVSVNFVSSDSIKVDVVADARGLNVTSITAIVKRYDDSTIATASLFDDGLHSDVGAGDEYFGNTFSMAQQGMGLFLNLAVTYQNGATIQWEHATDGIAGMGPLEIVQQIVSDNLNNDGIANPGENVRYVLTIHNGSAFNMTNLSLYFLSASTKKLEIDNLVSQSTFTQVYDPANPSSYNYFDVPKSYTDSSYKIYAFLNDTNGNNWQYTLKFPIQQFAQSIQSSAITHASGRGDWSFSVLAVEASKMKNHSYEISIVDSVDTAKHRGFTLRDVSIDSILLINHQLPDSLGHNIPVTDGFKIFRSANWGVTAGRFDQDSTRWVSSDSAWFTGSCFHDFSSSFTAFNHGVTFGSRVSYFYSPSFFGSSFDSSKSYPIEVRFDTSSPQKVYRIALDDSALSFKIKSTNSFVNVPFSAWDVTIPTSPRQLAVSWLDLDSSGTWNPNSTSSCYYENILIYNKSYDPTGISQFSMPPNAIQNECTKGTNADIVYALSLKLVYGHTLNESPGTLYIRPSIPLSSSDRFTFNPTVVSVRESKIPQEFFLAQNYPNPFNPATIIRYQLPIESRVSLKIYNILGQEVKTLIFDAQSIGAHSIVWNSINNAGRTVSSGVYFYRLEATGIADPKKSFVQVKKMVLIR